MKKLFIGFLSFSILASVGLVVYSQSFDWENPEGPPPDFNVAKPLNQGLGLQIKEGALKVLEGIGLGGWDPDPTSLVSSPSGFFGDPGAGTHIDNTDFESDVTAFLAKNEDSKLRVGTGDLGNEKLQVSANLVDSLVSFEQLGSGNILEIKSATDNDGLGTGQVNESSFGGSHSGTELDVSSGSAVLQLEKDQSSFIDNTIWEQNLRAVDIELDDSGSNMFVLNWLGGPIEKRRTSDGSLVWTINAGELLTGGSTKAIAYSSNFLYVFDENSGGSWTITKVHAGNKNTEWSVKRTFGNGLNGFTRASDVISDGQFVYLAGTVADFTGTSWPLRYRIEKRRVLDGAIADAFERSWSTWGFSSVNTFESIAIEGSDLYASIALQTSSNASTRSSKLFKIDSSDMSIQYEVGTILTLVGNTAVRYHKKLAIGQDFIYLVGNWHSQVAAYDKNTGVEQFQIDTGAFTPFAVAYNNDGIFLAGAAGVEKRNKDTGAFVWNQPDKTVTTIVERDGAIYVGGHSSNIYPGTGGNTLQKRNTDTGHGFFTSGNYTSAVFDTGQLSDLLRIFWQGDFRPDTSVSFQISTSGNNLDWTPFVGPSGTTGSFYTNSGTQNVHSIHEGHRFVRYKAYLSTGNIDRSPEIAGVTISLKEHGVDSGDSKTHVTITGAGNVGIKTGNPQAPLDVNGPIAQRGNTQHADVAEDYRIVDESDKGTIMRVSSEGDFGVEKSVGKHDEKVIGVISTSPGYRINAGKPDWKPIALVGRVPVKVNLENGPIEPGDAITSSSTPGEGMKLVGDGPRIGFALDSFDGTTETVFMFVNVSN